MMSVRESESEPPQRFMGARTCRAMAKCFACCAVIAVIGSQGLAQNSLSSTNRCTLLTNRSLFVPQISRAASSESDPSAPQILPILPCYKFCQAHSYKSCQTQPHSQPQPLYLDTFFPE